MDSLTIHHVIMNDPQSCKINFQSIIIMNFFKYHFLKKYWHNKRQGRITAVLLLAAVIFMVCNKTTYRCVSSFINDNLLLSFTITALLLVKFIICRIFYVSKIENGNFKAKGCANSSCLLTIVLGILLSILTIKGCKRHLHLKNHVETTVELATTGNRTLPPSKNPKVTNAYHNVTTMACSKPKTK